MYRTPPTAQCSRTAQVEQNTPGLGRNSLLSSAAASPSVYRAISSGVNSYRSSIGVGSPFPAMK